MMDRMSNPLCPHCTKPMQLHSIRPKQAIYVCYCKGAANPTWNNVHEIKQPDNVQQATRRYYSRGGLTK